MPGQSALALKFRSGKKHRGLDKQSSRTPVPYACRDVLRGAMGCLCQGTGLPWSG